MTSYEQYTIISEYIKATWTTTPVFMIDEPINVPLPYLVLRSYGVTNRDINNTIREDIRGYDIMAYDDQRGKVERMLSDILDTFNKTKVQELDVCGLVQNGPQVKLDEEIYTGMVTFQVKSYKV